MNKKYEMISKDDERVGQYSSRQRATLQANIQTAQTGMKHQIFLTTTYRNLLPMVCWTVVLALKYNANGGLVTA